MTPDLFERKLPATISGVEVRGLLYRRGDLPGRQYQGNLTASADDAMAIDELRDRGELLIYSGLVKEDGAERPIVIAVTVHITDGPNAPLLEVTSIGPERAS